ncbi:MAG TPA: TNT domain-containing protein [Actinomycetota bacterium]|nr:TNT domain-containing protein [Actinomycetota bacterium]
MNGRRWAVLVVVVSLLLSGGVVAGQAATAATHHPRAGGSTTCSTAYFGGDNRLGPEDLPTSGPILPIVRHYDRLAGLTPAQFLATYWDPAANGGAGGWRYPPANGFMLNGQGRPIESTRPLAAGQEIDRFGSEFGAFLAPRDEAYARRALPPMSLDTFDPAYTCNYHLYKVLKPFEAETGPIAPGFGQPGHGIQYQIVASLLPGNPATGNVSWLISNGYLAREN